MFTHEDAIAAGLTAASLPGDERVWRMPLYQACHRGTHIRAYGRGGGGDTPGSPPPRLPRQALEFSLGCSVDPKSPPLPQEYADQLKGKFCDLHSTAERWGGSCTQACMERYPTSRMRD